MSDTSSGATNGAPKLKLICNGGQLTAENGIEIKGNSKEIKGLSPDEPAVTLKLIPDKEKDDMEEQNI